jgi:hypothetical protein
MRDAEAAHRGAILAALLQARAPFDARDVYSKKTEDLLLMFGAAAQDLWPCK